MIKGCTQTATYHYDKCVPRKHFCQKHWEEEEDHMSFSESISNGDIDIDDLVVCATTDSNDTWDGGGGGDFSGGGASGSWDD